MTSSDRERAAELLAYHFVAGVLLVNWWQLSENQIDIPETDDWRKLVSGPHLLPRTLDLRGPVENAVDRGLPFDKSLSAEKGGDGIACEVDH
jgi:hypothetical protein